MLAAAMTSNSPAGIPGFSQNGTHVLAVTGSAGEVAAAVEVDGGRLQTLNPTIGQRGGGQQRCHRRHFGHRGDGLDRRVGNGGGTQIGHQFGGVVADGNGGDVPVNGGALDMAPLVGAPQLVGDAGELGNLGQPLLLLVAADGD